MQILTRSIFLRTLRILTYYYCVRRSCETLTAPPLPSPDFPQLWIVFLSVFPSSFFSPEYSLSLLLSFFSSSILCSFWILPSPLSRSSVHAPRRPSRSLCKSQKFPGFQNVHCFFFSSSAGHETVIILSYHFSYNLTGSYLYWCSSGCEFEADSVSSSQLEWPGVFRPCLRSFSNSELRSNCSYIKTEEQQDKKRNSSVCYCDSTSQVPQDAPS